MPKSKAASKHQAQLTEAGLQALEMRKQLAGTWLASQEIIDAMRAIRAAIPIGHKAECLPNDIAKISTSDD